LIRSKFTGEAGPIDKEREKEIENCSDQRAPMTAQLRYLGGHRVMPGKFFSFLRGDLT